MRRKKASLLCVPLFNFLSLSCCASLELLKEAKEDKSRSEWREN